MLLSFHNDSGNVVLSVRMCLLSTFGDGEVQKQCFFLENTFHGKFFKSQPLILLQLLIPDSWDMSLNLVSPLTCCCG